MATYKYADKQITVDYLHRDTITRARYIDTNGLFEQLGHINPDNAQEYYDIGMFMNMITNAPTENVAPIIHGKWEYLKSDIYRCSVCQYTSDSPTRYCPWCGAEMEREK